MPQSILNIIEKSGNTFHSKVARHLRGAGWTVLISPYYHDSISNKPREIDLLAEKAFSYPNFGTVNIRLFVECKYVTDETVFWFDQKDVEKSRELIKKITPSEFDQRPSLNTNHYMQIERVAKLFADERKKGSDNEFFYKALNQSLNATVYFRPKGSICRADQRRYIRWTMNYPVILCNSFEKLYRTDIDLDSEPSRLDQNFCLEVNYAYLDPAGNNANEYFLIDVLSFTDIEKYLAIVQEDAHSAAQWLNMLGLPDSKT